MTAYCLDIHIYIDATFRDPHALWVQHASGAFAQVDLRRSVRPIDAVPRVALSWNVGIGGDTDGALAFVSDKRARWEVPYDDMSVLSTFFRNYFFMFIFHDVVTPINGTCFLSESSHSNASVTSLACPFCRIWVHMCEQGFEIQNREHYLSISQKSTLSSLTETGPPFVRKMPRLVLFSCVGCK